MPVPKRKVSKCRRDSRTAHHRLDVKAYALCGNCSSANMPHEVCHTCGFYKGRKVVRTKLERAMTRGAAAAQAAQQPATEQ